MQKMHLELQVVTVEWRWPFKLSVKTSYTVCVITGKWCQIARALLLDKIEGDVAQWLERLQATRSRTPLLPCGVFREAALFLPS